MVKLDSLMATDNFGGEVDFLLEHRERLPSDTCMTSSEYQTSSDSQRNLLLNFEVGEQDNETCLLAIENDEQTFSDNLINDDAASAIRLTTYSQDEDDQENNLSEMSQEQHDIQISDLQPVQVLNSNEHSTNTSEKAQPLFISREGKRKQHVSSPATMISHNVRRRKKTSSQVDYLRTLYNKLGGKWNGQVRKEAMQKTGLSRIQIYKWFFDM